DGGRGPVTRAQSLAQGDALRRDVQEHASGDGNAIAANDDCAFELGDVLDLLADLAVTDIALGPAVAAERIEVDRPGHGQDLPRIANHEHGADRLALAALPANLCRQVHDGPQGFQRYLRVEPAQLLGAETFQVFAQVDDTQAVDVLRLSLFRLDAVV